MNYFFIIHKCIAGNKNIIDSLRLIHKRDLFILILFTYNNKTCEQDRFSGVLFEYELIIYV